MDAETPTMIPWNNLTQLNTNTYQIEMNHELKENVKQQLIIILYFPSGISFSDPFLICKL